MTPPKFSTADKRRRTRIRTIKICVLPRSSVEMKLRSSPGKRQQRDVACLLDGGRQPPLVGRAYSRQAAWHDLAAFRDELPQEPVVLVVDGLNFFHAELADFLAPKILAASFAASRSAWATRPR